MTFDTGMKWMLEYTDWLIESFFLAFLFCLLSTYCFHFNLQLNELKVKTGDAKGKLWESWISKTLLRYFINIAVLTIRAY